MKSRCVGSIQLPSGSSTIEIQAVLPSITGDALAAAMRQNVRVLAIDLKYLKRDVAPALAVEGGIVGRIRGLLDDQHP